LIYANGKASRRLKGYSQIHGQRPRLKHWKAVARAPSEADLRWDDSARKVPYTKGDFLSGAFELLPAPLP
jgi:hypothetical protein